MAVVKISEMTLKSHYSALQKSDLKHVIPLLDWAIPYSLSSKGEAYLDFR